LVRVSRLLARQFARPSGWLGYWIIAPWLDRIAGPMNRHTLAQLDLARDDHVLEIGFGGGGLLAMILAGTDGEITGVDISPAMVKRASRRFASSDRLRLIEASVEALPIERGSIDKACSVNNLYFWRDPEKALAELARVVRPGGTLAISFEPPIELRKWPGHRHGFRLFEEEELASLMTSAGFASICRSEGFGRKPDCFLCLTAERVAVDAAE
jgi:arsenite methyltransferase